MPVDPYNTNELNKKRGQTRLGASPVTGATQQGSNSGNSNSNLTDPGAVYSGVGSTAPQETLPPVRIPINPYEVPGEQKRVAFEAKVRPAQARSLRQQGYQTDANLAAIEGSIDRQGLLQKVGGFINEEIDQGR